MQISKKRNFLSESKSNMPKYIEDGLFSMYDGILNSNQMKHIEVTDVWDDLLGNMDSFNLTNTIVNNNSMTFTEDPSSNGIISNAYVFLQKILSSGATIEFDSKIDTSRGDSYTFFSLGNSSNSAFWSWGNKTSNSGRYLTNNSSSAQWTDSSYASKYCGNFQTYSFKLTSSQMVLYIDGQSIVTKPSGGRTSFSSTMPFYIGRISDYGFNTMDITMANIRIYDRILTDNEISYNVEQRKARFHDI